MSQRVDLKDLVNLEEWQKIQDSFSESLDITLRTIDLSGKLLTKTSGPRRLCSKIPSNIPRCSDYCGNCVLNLKLKDEIKIKKLTNAKCHFGLDVFVLPISAVGDSIAAYMIVGPLIPNKRKSKAEYEAYAKEVDVDIEELMDALVEINVFTYNRMRSVSGLLSDIFSYMAKTGYHKKRLSEIAPELIGSDPMFLLQYEEKVLRAFLDSCTIALDADSGSVMTLNRNSNTLRIKVASKLSQSVIDDTDIKLGDGIAGVAAATAEPIILPKDEKKNGLSRKMTRKYIRSSMIVPFRKANESDVYGVLNLNIVRRKKEFSEKDTALVKELTNLASIALAPLSER